MKLKVTKKSMALATAMILACGCGVGGTMAWLTAGSETVTNTFTSSDIDIALTETKENFQMVPGWTIEKDPKVTVDADSEACWLFVEITESTNPDLDDYIKYDLVSGWELVKTEDKDGDSDPDVIVVGRIVAKGAGANGFDVIGYTDDKGTADTADDEFVANKVLVDYTVDKTLMEAIDGVDADGKEVEEAQPTLTFKAYAVQLYSTNGVEFEKNEAWANASAIPQS